MKIPLALAIVNADPAWCIFKLALQMYVAHSAWRAKRHIASCCVLEHCNSPATRAANFFNWLVLRSKSSPIDPDYRKWAMRFKITDSGFVPAANHTHAGAAKTRNDAIRSIRDFLQTHDLVGYDPSVSNSYRDHGVDGHRHVHSVKDICSSLRFKIGAYPRSSVITLVDTDYYLNDLDEYAPRPIILYTLNLPGLSGRTDDSTWYFNTRSTVVELISGGASYEHPVHDYAASDLIVIEHATMDPNWLQLCNPWSHKSAFTVYDVHRHPIDGTNKQVVFLCPNTTVNMSLWRFQLYSRVFMGKQLDVPILASASRITEIGKFLVLKCWVNGVLGVSFKRKLDQSSDSAVFLPEAMFNGLVHIALTRTTPGEIGRYLISWKYPMTGASTATLEEFFKVELPSNQHVNLYFAPVTSRGDGFDNVPPGKGVSVAPAILENVGGVLIQNDAADRKYLEERLKPNVNSKEFPAEFITYRREFLEKIAPEHRCGTVAMNTVQQVVDQQDRPAQQARNENTLRTTPSTKKEIRVAIKVETLNKIGAPRAISNVTGDHGIDASRIAHAIKPELMHLPFYLIGTVPQGVASKIRDLSELALTLDRTIVETDYSKCDETISAHLRTVLEMYILRMFPYVEHELIRQILDDDKNVPCRLNKVKFNSRGKNNSGSPFTSDLNTLVGAFIVFCHHRQRGETIENAIYYCGVAVGDDGLSIGGAKGEEVQFAASLTEVANILGMKLKVETHQAGGPLFFLGRLYPSPLLSFTSMSLPSVALAKLPIVTSQRESARADKFRGYYVTERNTPVTSNYIRAVARLYRFNVKKLCTEKEKKALKNRDKDMWYKTHCGPVPYDPCTDLELLVDAVAVNLQLSVGDVHKLMEQLDGVKSFEDLAKVRIFNAPVVGIDEVIRTL